MAETNDCFQERPLFFSFFIFVFLNLITLVARHGMAWHGTAIGMWGIARGKGEATA